MNIERIVEYAFIHNEHNHLNTIRYKFVLFAIILELEKNNCIKFERNENNALILKVKNTGKNISKYERMVLDEFLKYNKSDEMKVKSFFKDYLHKIIYYGGRIGNTVTNWSILRNRIIEKIENKLKDEEKYHFNYKFFSLKDLIFIGSNISLFFISTFISAKLNMIWIMIISLFICITINFLFWIVKKMFTTSFITEKGKEEEKIIEETHLKLLNEYFTDLNIQYSNFYNWKENIIFETVVSNMKTGKDLIKNKEKYKLQNEYYKYLELYEELYRMIY